MRTLMVCALTPERLLSKAEIAQACNASQNHLAHVIVDLSRLGLIHTVRGRNGGVCLAKTPSEISLGLVVRALESRSPLVDCFDPARARCPITPSCRLHGVLDAALEAFYSVLDLRNLADLIYDNDGLRGVLALPGDPARAPGN